MRNYALHASLQHDVPAVSGLLTRIWSNWRKRLTADRLAAFDDHALRDIGVTRADIATIRSAPLVDWYAK